MDRLLPAPHWHGVDLGWAYGSALHGVVRQLRCRDAARDALHDAFVRLGLAVRDRAGSPIEEPHAYFRAVLRSVLADLVRRRALAPMAASDCAAADEDPCAALERLQSDLAPSAEQLLVVRRRLEALSRLLDRLPPRCREVFWLLRIEGLAQREIAVRLGISLNTVERHAMRALLDLRAWHASEG